LLRLKILSEGGEEKMAIIIFGGDRLGKIPQLLYEQGFSLVDHVTGRKKGHQKIEIPQAVEGILVFTDYLNHLLAVEIKTAAKRKGIKALFVKRSWSQLSQALQAFKAVETRC
jgi:hypothetical protein